MDNGNQAIELIRDSLEAVRRLGRSAAPQYSLILLDYSLPNMDGPTVARKIFQLYEVEYLRDVISKNLRPPHIVCLTAFTEKIFEEKAKAAGMKDFVSKPIDTAKLRGILKDNDLITVAEALEY